MSCHEKQDADRVAWVALRNLAVDWLGAANLCRLGWITMSGDIAIVHEKLLGYGGAQHVAFEHARTFEAPIYAGWVDEEYVPADVDARQVFSERSKHILKGPVAIADAFHMLQWQWVEELYEYDKLIINKPNCSWFVPRPDQTIIYYAHHPPRQTYDQWHRKDDPSILERATETVKRVVYRHPLDYPDKIVANSEVTAHRFNRYLGIDVDEVVYPPVNTARYSPDLVETDGYLLSLGRLAPNKRIGEIIDAVEATDWNLIIAGDGGQRNRLESRANGNVRFTGDVNEREKAELLSGAGGFVMNAEQEDFGLAPVEAMASGTPVIGVDEGFTSRQIRDGVNGRLYQRGQLEDVLSAFDSGAYDPDTVSESAAQYDVSEFRQAIRGVVNDAA